MKVVMLEFDCKNDYMNVLLNIFTVTIKRKRKFTESKLGSRRINNMKKKK